MPISNSDQLFKLINSLDKAEKRNFKLFVNRLNVNKEGKTLLLFEALEKMNSYDEKALLKKLNLTKASEVSNIKRHLYDQILKSLRLIHSSKDTDIQIREQLDYAKILYGKGLYLQSLKLLDRVKDLAKNAEQEIIFLEIMEFQKMIESRHITRSRNIENKMEGLIRDSAVTRDVVARTSRLSNLSLKIQGLYIKLGFVKSKKEQFLVNEYFTSNFPTSIPKNMGFYEEVLLSQSNVWYNYMLMEFEESLHHSIKWVQVFEKNVSMKSKDPNLYIRGIHYVLTNSFYLKKIDLFIEYLDIYKEHLKTELPNFNINTQILNFNYYYNAQINYYLITKQYKAGLEIIPEVLENIKKFSLRIDSHRVLMFYYKIAWLLICEGQYDQAIDYLNLIHDNKKDHLRKDLVAYSKLLHLICHKALGNHTLVNNLSPTVKRHFDSSGEMSVCIQAILTFLNKHPNINDREQSIEKLEKKLMASYHHSFEKRCFIYFNFIGWIKSLKNAKTMLELQV